VGADWAPFATRQQFSGYAGGTVTGAARKVTLHTTETTGFPGYNGGAAAPHLTLNPKTGEARQHIALSRSAYALASPGPPQSPNMNAGTNIQVEIIAYAKDTPGYDDEWYAQLGEWVGWLVADWDIPVVFLGDFVPNASGSTRQAWDKWAPASGLTGHQHVPHNDHWDPGGLDQNRLLAHLGGGQDDMPLNAQDLDQIAGIVREQVLDIVRKEGISGAANGLTGGEWPSTPVADTVIAEIRKIPSWLEGTS
jgi:hypothetical protein